MILLLIFIKGFWSLFLKAIGKYLGRFPSSVPQQFNRFCINLGLVPLKRRPLTTFSFIYNYCVLHPFWVRFCNFHKMRHFKCVKIYFHVIKISYTRILIPLFLVAKAILYHYLFISFRGFMPWKFCLSNSGWSLWWFECVWWLFSFSTTTWLFPLFCLLWLPPWITDHQQDRME